MSGKRVGGFWIEVRPLATGRFEVGNFLSVLEFLHNSGGVFMPFMVNCSSTVVEGRRAVRFFLQLERKELADSAASLLRTTMDVEVVEASPPVNTYEHCADLELKWHYGLPICELDGKTNVNPVDRIVGNLSLGEAALEIVAVRDYGARHRIGEYIWKKTHPRAGPGGAVLEIVQDMLDAFLGSSPQKIRKEPTEVQLDPSVKARLNAAEKKMNKKLFACNLRVYGTQNLTDVVMDALPSSSFNSLKRYRTLKLAEAPASMRKPGRYRLQNAFSNLCWITPLLILFSALYFKLFNPLRLSTVDILIMVVAAASVFPLAFLFRRRKPIVLSLDELSSIVGMPAAVGTLPVDLGTARTTKRWFPTGPATIRPTAVRRRCVKCGVEVPAGVTLCPRCGGETV